MRFKRCRGQSLALIALGLVVLLGFVAFAIDFGVDYSARQKMRNNTDAAALAGAQSLTNAAAAKTAAANYYASNMGLTSANVTVLGTNGNTTQYRIGEDTVDITTPYSDSKTQAKGIAPSNAIRVSACRKVRHHFGSLFGLLSSQYCMRSVAILSSGSGGFAVWADSEVEIEGNNNVVGGSTHTNQALTVIGNSNSISGTSFYVTSAQIRGNNNRITTQRTTAKTKPSVPNTLDYYKALARANGTYYVGNKTLSGNNMVLSGVIFVDGGNLKIKGNNISGTVTFVTSGGRIEFDGNGFRFTAYVDKLVAYTGDRQRHDDVEDDDDHGGCDGRHDDEDDDDDSGIKVTGNNANFSGTLYTTTGDISVGGNNFALTGALISGRRAQLRGNNAHVTFNGSYGLGSSVGSALLE